MSRGNDTKSAKHAAVPAVSNFTGTESFSNPSDMILECDEIIET